MHFVTLIVVWAQGCPVPCRPKDEKADDGDASESDDDDG